MILPGAAPFLLPGGRHGVLLIHGFTGLPAELQLMGQYLNDNGFTVLAVRLAGHGTTEEDMSHMTAEDWMDSVRDGAAILDGLCEEVSVVGHSMGGLFALELASEYPVTRVVTLAAPIFIAKERGIDYLPSRELSDGLFVPKARRRLKDVPRAANHTYRRMPLISVHELLDVIDATKGCIERVYEPCLIMQSRDDQTADPRSAVYIYNHLPGSKKELYWFEHGGHLLPLSEPRETVFRETVRFLKDSAGEEKEKE